MVKIRAFPIWRRAPTLNKNKKQSTYRLQREQVNRKMVSFDDGVLHRAERPALQRTLTPGVSLSSMFHNFDGNVEIDVNKKKVVFDSNDFELSQKYTLFQRTLTPYPASNSTASVDHIETIIQENEDINDDTNLIMENENTRKDILTTTGTFSNSSNTFIPIRPSSFNNFHILKVPTKTPMNDFNVHSYHTDTPRSKDVAKINVKLPILTLSSCPSSSQIRTNCNQIKARQQTPRPRYVDVFGNDIITTNNDTENENQDGKKIVKMAIPSDYIYKGPLQRTLTPMFPPL